MEKMVTVELCISHKISPIDKKWDIKFERDLSLSIETPRFRFSSTSMNIAVTKVADLVARHPEYYFEKVTIQ